jgi:hypothetical protein
MAISSFIGRSTVTDVVSRVIGVAPAPLLPGESKAEYVGVAERVIGAAPPTDAIEEFLIRDVIDLTWEILRLRRLKAGVLRASTRRGIAKVMDSIGYREHIGFPERLAESWAEGDKDAKDKVAAALEKAQLTMEDVMAQTLALGIDSFERIDRMVSSSEARRNNALREIGSHREALGAAVRRASDEIQDAVFQDVETGAVGGRTPS